MISLRHPKTLVGACLAAATFSFLPTSASAAVDQRSSDAIQQDLEAVVAAGAPGAVASITHGGATWSGAAGLANIADNTPARPNDSFRIGSVTKPMVAAAFMRQVEDGTISLDDTVASQLGNIVPFADEITMAQLLSHRSGIPNYTAKMLTTPEEILAAQNDKWTAEQLIEGAVVGEPASKAPGSFEYSNTNYVVLGEVLEKVTNQPLSELLRHDVFLPAGMNSTIYRQEDPVISGEHLRGYIDVPDDGLPAEDTTSFNPSFYQGAGAVISTSGDVAKFFSALTSGKLVSKSSLDRMLEGTNPAATDLGGRYGLGVYVLASSCAPEGRLVAHDGSVFGYNTFVASTIDGATQVSTGMNAMTAANPAIAESFLKVATDNTCQG